MEAPLLVTADPDLLDDLLRLSAAAGVELEVAHDPASALRQWSAAALVMVGPDLSASVASKAPPRRADVFLLSRGEPDYRTAVALGAAEVISLPAGEAWLVEALADVGDGGAGAATTIGFIGGSGGVGASTLACATAVIASATRATALVDLDPLGAGVERIAGLEQDGLTWGDLTGSRGRLGSRALRDALPHRDGLAVLGWGDASAPQHDEVAVREALSAAQRGHALVVADLPRQLDGVAAEIAARCDQVVLVGACSLAGAAAAVRTLGALAPVARSVHLMARTTSGAVTPAALAEALGLPLVGEVAGQRGLEEQLDLGLGPVRARRGAVAQAARHVLARLVDS